MNIFSIKVLSVLVLVYLFTNPFTLSFRKDILLPILILETLIINLIYKCFNPFYKCRNLIRFRQV